MGAKRNESRGSDLVSEGLKGEEGSSTSLHHTRFVVPCRERVPKEGQATELAPTLHRDKRRKLKWKVRDAVVWPD